MTQQKDLIIGAIDGYDWNRIKYWVNSIEKSGFDGFKAMIVFKCDKDTIKKLVDKGFTIVGFHQDEEGNTLAPKSRFTIHVDRFFHIWNLLRNLQEDSIPRFVIATDVKDVIFQSNPSEWLEKNLGDKRLVAGSEAIQYANEPWGKQNLIEAFGSYFYEIFKDKPIYNVGTVAGSFEYMRDLSFVLFQMSMNRPIPIVDQAVFNILLYNQPWFGVTKFCDMSDGWAVQAGTVADPSKITAFRPHLLEQPPMLSWEGDFVKTWNNVAPCIVHQYDRVPIWKDVIEKKYDDAPAA